MNHLVTSTARGSVSASNLADWALSHGLTSLDTPDVMHLCGLPANQVSQRMAPLRKSGKILSPARGLWVPVSPEYRAWGAPDPLAYIDDMMTHLGVSYLVGWLSSAERHGASHHAPQVFQVATDKVVRSRVVGRSSLDFYVRGFVGKATESRGSRHQGGAHIASPGTTMLMLASDPALSGGLANVANLIIELAEENPDYASEVATDARLFPDVASRRLGWMLDTFADGAPPEIEDRSGLLVSEPSFLSPTSPRVGRLDAKWHIVINEEVAPDL